VSDGYGVKPRRQDRTTRELLDIAARHVAETERLGLRPAKARVHDMTLVELVQLPPVRALLFDAALAARP
jgi:hypothetical protein